MKESYNIESPRRLVVSVSDSGTLQRCKACVVGGLENTQLPTNPDGLCDPSREGGHLLARP